MLILKSKSHVDRKRRILSLSQAYLDIVITRFSKQTVKKCLLPFRHNALLFKDQCPKIDQEKEEITAVPHAYPWINSYVD